jgi:hypothetical protein
MFEIEKEDRQAPRAGTKFETKIDLRTVAEHSVSNKARNAEL